jgi:hypothetical protein
MRVGTVDDHMRSDPGARADADIGADDAERPDLTSAAMSACGATTRARRSSRLSRRG